MKRNEIDILQLEKWIYPDLYKLRLATGVSNMLMGVSKLCQIPKYILLPSTAKIQELQLDLEQLAKCNVTVLCWVINKMTFPSSMR